MSERGRIAVAFVLLLLALGFTGLAVVEAADAHRGDWLTQRDDAVRRNNQNSTSHVRCGNVPEGVWDCLIYPSRVTWAPVGYHGFHFRIWFIEEHVFNGGVRECKITNRYIHGRFVRKRKWCLPVGAILG